jgi:hypothetical protein
LLLRASVVFCVAVLPDSQFMAVGKPLPGEIFTLTNYFELDGIAHLHFGAYLTLVRSLVALLD